MYMLCGVNLSGLYFLCCVCHNPPRPAMLADQNTPHTATSIPPRGITARRVTTGAVVVVAARYGWDSARTGHPLSIPVPTHQKERAGAAVPSQGGGFE